VEAVSGVTDAASRLARISLTNPLDGVVVLLDGVLVLLVDVNEEFSNMARVAANDVSRFTLPTESLSGVD